MFVKNSRKPYGDSEVEVISHSVRSRFMRFTNSTCFGVDSCLSLSSNRNKSLLKTCRNKGRVQKVQTAGYEKIPELRMVMIAEC